MLGTGQNHREVSKNWFDEVVSTPVRSVRITNRLNDALLLMLIMYTAHLQSVPPLYEALQRIWQWIDTVIELPPSTSLDNEPIARRPPWWERLVEEVSIRENEVLCLT